VEKFNVKKLSYLEGSKKYKTGVSKRFASSEKLYDNNDINSACEKI
jgi:hypothetical protein